jgi:hypothetical protein
MIRSTRLHIAGLLLVLMAGFCSPLTARDPEYITKNSEGREFWLCFMKNFRSSDDRQNRQAALKLQLFLTSSHDAKVRIEIDEIGYDNTVDVKANTVVNVQIPAKAQLRAIETAERLAVHITADTAISVYGLNSRFQTTDTFMGLPVSVLGTTYRAVGYTKLASDLLSAISIVATEDDTDVEITPTANSSTGRPAGKMFKVRLRKGDVYTLGSRWESIGQCDLTGTLINATKKIAVFSGHNCAYVPPKVDACNHLVEQLPPVTAWGMHYYLGNLKERSRYTYRVIASENQTRVFEDSRLVAVLRAGEFHENLNVNRHVQLTADKPVLVAQYAQGFKNGDSVGDPMMILVSPTQQFLKDYRFATPINGEWHHYVNVVAPTESISQVRLNGRRIDSSLFEVLGESRYSIAQVPIPFGTHVIRSETPFGLYSYGFGYKGDAYDAYGNMAGQSFQELSTLVDSMAPQADGRLQRDDYYITFRDDRVMDKGLKSIEVLSSYSLEANIPKIEPGAPQVTIRVRPTVSGQGGRIVFKATDMADNTSDFTICYVFDNRSERYVFQLNEGKHVECSTEETWIVGAYAMLAHDMHDANFASSGGVSAEGTFQNGGEGLGIGGGVLVGRRVMPDLILNARLGVATLGGDVTAPDTTIGTVYDTASKSYLPYQEATVLAIDAPYLRIGATAQWFAQRYFYLTAGFDVSIPMGSAADVQRTILRPTGWEYADGTIPGDPQPTEISSLSSIGFDVLAGLGLSYPVSYHASVFMEAMYRVRLNSLVSDATWNTSAIGLNVGLLWRL